MMSLRFLHHRRLTLGCAMMLALSGCASVSLEQNLDRVNAETASLTEGKLSLIQSQEEKERHAQQTATLLASPVGQKEAIQLSLLNSPALQMLLAQGWAESAEAAQTGRIGNPWFSFERIKAGDELELGRALSFGLLDVLTLPWRQGKAEHLIEHSQLRLASEVVDHATRVRQAWVRAVAAQQSLIYAQQVFESAEASAELARRMAAVGNFNRLRRAREHSFYADAAIRLATAKHQVLASREELVRLLGLDEAQANKLQLPERLPDLPAQALDTGAIGALATRTRLDIRLAQSAWESASKAQGLNGITSFTDIELTGIRNTTFDNAEGTQETARGFEVEVRLPIFDWGGMQRDAWNARTLAAANQLEDTVRAAGSSLRESYSAYRTAHDIARHFRDEVIPLRKVISEENLLRYNGMIIDVFELLADARDQVTTVVAAMDAEQQFWLADAALQASLLGRPTSASLSVSSSVPQSGGAGH